MSGITYYDADNRRLVFTGKKATPDYWDHHWQDNNIQDLLATGGTDITVPKLTQKYLPCNESTRVIDAGCGKGQHVAALHNLGYDAYGVDFAPRIVNQINHIRPELKVRQADVRDLPFPDNFFDGYWSLGLIEHFWHGYQKLLKEMNRVIKPQGFAFLVFPHLSYLRRIKAALGAYPPFIPTQFDRSAFYQFAFDDNEVCSVIEKLGYTLVSRHTNNGIKGLKDEISSLQPALQRLYDSSLFPLKILKVSLSKATQPITNHSIILVFRKQP